MKSQHPAFLFFISLMGFVLIALAALAPQPGPLSTPVDLSGYPWLYLREGDPLVEEEACFEIIAVGDVMSGRGLADEPDPFGQAAPWLQAADLTLGNLEGALAPSELSKLPSPAAFNSEPIVLVLPLTSIKMMQRAGFDLLSLANNHALDLGTEGLVYTVAQLTAGGLQPIGVDPRIEGGQRTIIYQRNGVRLAFLAFNAVSPPPGSESDGVIVNWHPDEITATIKNLHNQADGVVVFAHWGREYDTHIAPFQQEIADILFEAGADLVIGHHPHVVQGTRVFPASEQNPASGDQLTAFSLGNFVFDQFEGQTQQDIALRAFFDQEGLRAVQALPLVSGKQPRLIPPDEATALLERIIPPPRPLEFLCTRSQCSQVSTTAEARSGLLWSGEIDLTGDHQPEKISRQGDRVVIYENGETVWRSPADWRVRDVAMGDPNDDGRNELLIIFYRPDVNGVLQSHPFIIGFRGGTYRTLWGGSAASDPILEVELGDLDGDGSQEMVVLEGQGEQGQSAVSVWRWHGWGFSLLWRSAVDIYRDITLVEAPESGIQLIQVNRLWHQMDSDISRPDID